MEFQKESKVKVYIEVADLLDMKQIKDFGTKMTKLKINFFINNAGIGYFE